MCRKIFIAALLCPVILSTMMSLCHAQRPTVAEAITLYHSSGSTACRYVNVYGLLPSNVNSDPLRTTKYFVAWYLVGTSSVSVPNAYNVLVSHGTCVITQQPDGFRAFSFSTQIPVLSEASGTAVNVTPTTPSLTTGRDFIRCVYSVSAIETWYHGYNTALSNVPETLPGGYHLSTPSLYPRDESELTRDVDGGGIADWDEVFRSQYPGSDPYDWSDDKDCICESCCTCQCICGFRGFPKTPLCRGRSEDCGCHRTCTCAGGYPTCCECKCTCGTIWKTHCDGTINPETGCHCHACHCGACCECRCICGGGMEKTLRRQRPR